MELPLITAKYDPRPSAAVKIRMTTFLFLTTPIETADRKNGSKNVSLISTHIRSQAILLPRFLWD